MNSTKYVIIQTALRPMKVVIVENTDFHITEVADFQGFFDAMAISGITSSTEILVNRGPGSYSGIRTGIAYVYGLLHGGLINMKQVHTFTSFDFVRAATGHSRSIYLKAWPRLPSGKIEESKGYFEESKVESAKIKVGIAQTYKSWEEISETKELLIIGEESIKTKHEYRTYSDILRDPVGYRELIDGLEQYNVNMDPLYINPVHIS